MHPLLDREFTDSELGIEPLRSGFSWRTVAGLLAVAVFLVCAAAVLVLETWQ